jgi:hypothetical protein
MIKKLLIHIVFFALLIFVYVIFGVFYSRKIAIGDAVTFYIILTTTVYCINLVRTRQTKWTIVLSISLIALFVMIYGHNSLADNPFDAFFIDSLTETMPFLPRFHLRIDSYALRATVIYLIYYCGAILYWYCIYFFSKKIVAWKRKMNNCP